MRDSISAAGGSLVGNLSEHRKKESVGAYQKAPDGGKLWEANGERGTTAYNKIIF